jgi:hypothetical protein
LSALVSITLTIDFNSTKIVSSIRLSN